MSKPRKSVSRSRAWRRFIHYLFWLVVALILAGFMVFAFHVSNPKLPSPLPKADGIVVLTGKGGGRLKAGASLLKMDHGERLLISGVNVSNSREYMLDILELSPETYDCCVDLDYAAKDTAGNARETAIWLEALNYEHIILVTSAYHMPRAETEISAARGRIRITPYPVMSSDTPGWWSQTRRLMTEYGKLLLTYARRPSGKTHRGPPILEEIPEPVIQP